MTTKRQPSPRLRVHNAPRPARRTWQPIELTRPGWEVEAAARMARLPEMREVPAYTGTSRLRAKINQRRHQEATS